MKFIFVSLAFFILSPLALATKGSYSPTAENCSHATQNTHTVDNSSYSRLLASLQGNTNKKRRKIRDQKSTGQR